MRTVDGLFWLLVILCLEYGLNLVYGALWDFSIFHHPVG